MALSQEEMLVIWPEIVVALIAVAVMEGMVANG
jgi:hypothetical protein